MSLPASACAKPLIGYCLNRPALSARNRFWGCSRAAVALESGLTFSLAMTRRPPPPIPTLGELNSAPPHWVWWYCDACGRSVAVPLAPFLIRWGPDASSDALRKNPRCTKCSHRGGTIRLPSHSSSQMAHSLFPVELGVAAQSSAGDRLRS